GARFRRARAAGAWREGAGIRGTVPPFRRSGAGSTQSSDESRAALPSIARAQSQSQAEDSVRVADRWRGLEGTGTFPRLESPELSERRLRSRTTTAVRS